MKNVLLRRLVRFFPYESVHASDFLIEIEDKDNSWYNAICALLKQYEPVEYIGCSKGYFALRIDNKITLELKAEEHKNSIYITLWDNTVYISDAVHEMHKTMFCTVKHI